jgi:hypothetical protein
MKPFLAKLGLFVLLQGAIAAVLFGHAKDNPNHYLAATIEKHKRLEAPSEKPRIIFVGGSSMAFGVSSPLVEQLLPGYRVVNMSLQAKVGAPFMLWEIANDLREGDLVVLGFEYEHYEQDMTSYYILRLIHLYPSNIRAIPWKQVPDRALSYIGHLTRLGRRGLTGRLPKAKLPFVRKGFNEYGDVVCHHEMIGGRAADRGPDSPPPGRQDPRGPLQGEKPPRYTGRVMEMLAEFDRHCRRMGATAYIVPPPARDIDYQVQAVELEALFDRLRADQPIEVIQSPGEAAYPMELFYDLPYHLNKDGADRRAADIAHKLGEVLGVEVRSHD